MLPRTPRTFIGSTSFTVAGRTGRAWEQAVRRAVDALPGVDSVIVDLSTGSVTVVASRPVDRADIAAVIDEAGHPLVP